MKCHFAHLPNDVEAYITTEPPNILINSVCCPKQKTRPCKSAGPCCLGMNALCRCACCFNNVERGVKSCRDTLESAATTGR